MRTTIIGRNKSFKIPNLSFASMALSADAWDNSTNTWKDQNSSNQNPSVPATYSPPDYTSSDSIFNNLPSLTFNTGKFLQLPYDNTIGRINANEPKYFYVLCYVPNTTTPQIIAEFGGSTHFFNVHMYTGGRPYVLCFNGTQNRTLVTGSANTLLSLTLVGFEFNGAKARAVINGTCYSTSLFSGWSYSSNANGIGVSANGTRTSGSTLGTGYLSPLLGGKIAEMACYNSASVTQTMREDYIKYIDAKYGTAFFANYTGYFG